MVQFPGGLLAQPPAPGRVSVAVLVALGRVLGCILVRRGAGDAQETLMRIEDLRGAASSCVLLHLGQNGLEIRC